MDRIQENEGNSEAHNKWNKENMLVTIYFKHNIENLI